MALFGVLALAHLPTLLLTRYIADDWSYVYLAAFASPGEILKMLWEAAHPLYGPWIVFVSFGAVPFGIGRVVSLALHLLNTYLFFWLLRRPALTKPIAVLASALFLVSPFYTIRGPSANGQYDMFLTAWLLSVLWMDDQRHSRRFLAPPCMIIAMGIEPIVMLEPLRILYLWSSQHNLLHVIRRVSVYWVIALVMLYLRFTVWAPSGHYVDLHPLKLDSSSIVRLVARSFHDIPYALAVAAYNTWTLVPMWQLVLIAVASLFAFWTLTPPRISRRELSVVPLGLGMFAVAALPYALIGEFLWPLRFESRFALIAQFGGIIAVVGLIQAVPYVALRRTLGFACLLICALSVAGDGKWLLLDAAIQQDLTEQAEKAIASRQQPEVWLLTFDPPSYHVLFRYRCLGANDLNVPIAVHDGDKRPRTFLYDKVCESPRPYCTISYFDKQPCPTRQVEARYVFDVSRSTIESLSLWDALGWTGRKPGGRLELPLN